MGQFGLGVLFDINQYFALGAQFNLGVFAPDLAIQGDIIFGMNVSIPRRQR